MRLSQKVLSEMSREAREALVWKMARDNSTMHWGEVIIDRVYRNNQGYAVSFLTMNDVKEGESSKRFTYTDLLTQELEVD